MGELVAVLLFILLLVWLLALAATPVVATAPVPAAASAAGPATSSAASSAAAPAAASAAAPAAAARPANYVVQPGDTLTRIAVRYGVTLAALLQANPEITNRDLIRPGQTIRVP